MKNTVSKFLNNSNESNQPLFNDKRDIGSSVKTKTHIPFRSKPHIKWPHGVIYW